MYPAHERRKMTLKFLGQQIHEARLAHRLTREDLARRASLSTSQVQSLEKGRNVTLTTFLQILEELPRLTTLRIEQRMQPLDVKLERREAREAVTPTTAAVEAVPPPRAIARAPVLDGLWQRLRAIGAEWLRRKE